MADKNLSLGTVFTGRVDKAFETAIKRLEKVTKDLNKSFSNLSRTGTSAAKGLDAVKNKAKQAKDEMKDLAKRTKQTGKQISNVRGAWERFTAAMKVTAAYGIAAASIYKLVFALREAVTEIVNYDQALKNLQAITGATDVEIVAMGKTIEDVARKTKFSTTEVATGMVLLGQAGFSATEAMQAIQATADLATGTLSSMQFTSDLLTTTIRAFGLQAIETTRAADVMANAINKSKLTIDKLRIAFNFVGSAAAQTGLSIEQTAASMMILANNGLRASTIGTGLRQVLARLLAPSRKLRDAFRSNGIALEQVNPRLVGYEKAIMRLAPILFDTEKKMVDMSKAYELFGLRGAQAAAVIIKAFVSTGAGSYDAMLEKVYQTGAAEEMAAKQAEGLGVKFKNLADRARLVAIAIGDAGFVGVLKAFVDVLRSLSSVFAEFLSTSIGKAIAQFTMLTTVLYGTSIILNTIGPGIMGLVASFAGLLGAVNPLLLVLPALFSILGYVVNRQREFTKQLEQNVIALNKNISVLDLYKKSLEMLREKFLKGEDVTSDYLHTLKRLTDAYPDLKSEIEGTVDAWGANLNAINKALGADTQKAIKLNIALIERYRNELENMVGWAVLWERIKSPITAEDPFSGLMDPAKIKEFKAAWKKIRLEKILEAWKNIALAMHNMGTPINEIIDKFSKFKISAENLKEVIKYVKGLEIGFKNLGKEAGKMGSELSETELNLRRRYLNMLYSMETDATKRIEAQYRKRLADANKYYSDKLDALKKRLKIENKMVVEADLKKRESALIAVKAELKSATGGRKENLELQKKALAESISVLKKKLDEINRVEGIAVAERNRLRIAAQEELDRHLLELERSREDKMLKVIALGRKVALGKEKLDVINREDLLKDVRKRIKEAEVKSQKDIVALVKQRLDETVADEKSTSDDIIAARTKYLTELLRLLDIEAKAKKTVKKQDQRDRKREVRDLLDTTKRQGEEYVALLTEAYNLELINYNEYLDKKIAATEGWIENFKHGLQRATEAEKTWSETAQDMGKGFKSVFSDELTSGIWDFIDGTKSASDAFRDFAKNVIRWAGEIITKFYIMQALTSFLPGLSKSGVPSASSMGGGGWIPIRAHHKGGVVGTTPAPVRIVNPNIFANAQRYHSGLRSDEFPAILQKGETVLPKGSSSGNVVINLINKSGTPLDAKQKKTQFTADEMILDVVIDAANRNKRGFKTGMQAALGV